MALNTTLQSVKGDIVKGKNVKAIQLNFFLSHTTVNTDFVVGDFSPEFITVSCFLKRKGKTYVIFNDKLKPLVFHSQIKSGSWTYINRKSSPVVTVLAKGAAVKAQGLVPLRIELPYTINLTGDDVLEVNYQGSAACYDSANVDNAVSQVYLDYIEDTQISSLIPFIKCYSIDAYASSFKKQLDDNVDKLTILNFDKTDRLDATRVIDTLNIKSSKVNFSSDFYGLIERTMSTVEQDGTVSRYQSYLIFENQDVDNVELDLTLQTAQVASGQNYVVLSGGILSGTTIDKAAGLRAKEDNELKSKLATVTQSATVQQILRK